MKNYKIISWNVNGIRAILKKDFLKDINSISPDIICIQETKANDVDAKKALEVFSDYYVFINHSKEKKGYSGTSIITKNKPINVINDIGISNHDIEGRVILAEFDEFKADFSLSARRAAEQAFLQLAKDIEQDVFLLN